MAENTEQWQDALRQATEALERYSDTYVEYFDDLKKLTKGTKEYNEAQTNLWKNLKKSLNEFEKSVKKGTATFDDSIKELERLEDALQHATNAEQRAAIEKNKEMIASIARQKAMDEAFSQSIKKMSSATISTTGNFVKSIQNNASATELSTALFTGVIDVTGSAMGGAGQALSGLGQTSTMLNGKFKWLGLGVEALGEGLQFFGEAAAPLAKFAVTILAKEVEKTITAFDAMSASGAMFADGMTGMRDASAASGLTLAQFSNVVKNNTEQLSASGLGMTTAARMIGSVGKEFDKNGGMLRKQLLKLGVGFEEQAELTAQVMSDMRAGQVGPLRANSQQIAAETAKYAENLRIISAVTGEDAKKKMAQVREQATQLAFQQKLAGMDETQRQNAVEAMGGMNSVQRKNYMDMVVFGHVINQEGAAMAALSGNLNQSTQEAYNLTMQGNFDLSKQMDINKRYNTGIQKDLIGFTSIGMAGAANVGGLAQALAEGFGKMLQEIKGATPEAIAEAQEMAKQQKNANDKLTTGVTNAGIAAQNLARDLETILTPAVGRYAEATASLLTAIETSMRNAGIEVGSRVNVTPPSPAEVQKNIERKRTAAVIDKNAENALRAAHPEWMEGDRYSPGSEEMLKKAEGRDARYLANLKKESEQMKQRIELAKKENKFIVPALESNLADKEKEIKKLEEKIKNKTTPATSVGKIKLANITTKSGVTFQVAADKKDQIQGFINDLESTGYKIKDVEGYAARKNGVMDYNPKTGKYDIPSGRASHHSTGTAIDINPKDNPNLKNQVVTDMPSNVSALAEKWGLGWGANWATQKDSMHFDTNPVSGGKDMSRDEVLRLLAEQNQKLDKINTTMAEGNRDRKIIKENTR